MWSFYYSKNTLTNNIKIPTIILVIIIFLSLLLINFGKISIIFIYTNIPTVIDNNNPIINSFLNTLLNMHIISPPTKVDVDIRNIITFDFFLFESDL